MKIEVVHVQSTVSIVNCRVINRPLDMLICDAEMVYLPSQTLVEQVKVVSKRCYEKEEARHTEPNVWKGY